MENMDDVLLDAEDKMLKSTDHLHQELSGLRTGKASPSLVEGIQVDYYGAPTRLRDLAGIATPEPRLIVINPFDPSARQNICQAILAASARWPGRMLALEMGGKNAAIVTEDADLDGAAREIAFAAYVTAGQRCTATSRVLVSRAVADALVERLAYIARETRIGAPDDADVFLGPVISAASRTRASVASTSAPSS